ncbi:hypothetical protein HYY70_05165 [Candidatus Woesearchaeota archaeon]|nr:hypothetical protein [Candidatus Woesearchaeota archaeon]
MDQRRRLEILKGSFESGTIGKEEYDKLKEKLEPQVKQFNENLEETKNADEHESPKKYSEKTLIISIGVIISLLAAILAFSFINKQQPKTLEELHVLNLKGKLNPSQGYVYKGVYSFVSLDNQWYTQLTSPKGTKTYSLALRYSPNDLKDIVIEGQLDSKLFDNKSEFYYTFNPIGKELSFVTLAVADFSTHMARVFEKMPIAACDRNETEPCKTIPIVTCEDNDKLVLYVKESPRFRVYYNDNCIVVEGNNFDLVKGVDRVLYNLYNIMEQEEV